MSLPELHLDITGILSERIGARHGVSRDQLRATGGSLLSILPSLHAAATSGALSYLHPPPLAAVQAVAAPLRERSVVVLGEPGAAGGATALARIGGSPRLTVVDAPDAALIRAIPGGLAESVLVVLDGPPWVRSLAAALAPQAAAVQLFAGDGTGDAPWAPVGATVWESPGSADARFGGVGLAALGLLAASGQDAEAALAASTAGAARCRSGEGMYENPALLLAAAALALEQHHDMQAPCWLVSSPRLLPWARWLGGAWGALTSREDASGGGLMTRRGAPGVAVQIGDEAALQALLEGGAARFVVAPGGVLLDSEGGEVLAGGAGQTLARLGRELQAAQLQQLARVGRPVITTRGSWLDVPRLVELSVVWLHAATAVAACRGGDPLTMDAADSWRLLLAENG